MKKIALIILALAFSFSLQSCIVSKSLKMAFFDNPYYDYKGAEFTSINVPMFLAKPIVKKALREDGESEELINLIKKVADVKILTISNGNPKMLADFSTYLRKNRFEEWMTVKNEDQIINFQAKQKGEVINNLLISVKSDKDFVLIDVSGKFSADDISRIINYSEKKDVKKLVSK